MAELNGNSGMDIGGATQRTVQGLRVGKSAVKGTAKVVKGGAKAAKGVGMAVKAVIGIISSLSAGGLVILGGALIVIVVIVCSIWQGQNKTTTEVDPDLEIIEAYYSEFLQEAKNDYKLHQVELNNEYKVKSVDDSKLIVINKRGEYNKLDLKLLYAGFYAYTTNYIDSNSGDTDKKTIWDNCASTWKTAKDSNVSCKYVIDTWERVISLFLYDENGSLFPTSIKDGRNMALLVTDTYMKEEYPNTSDDEEKDNKSHNANYERNYKRIIDNIWYALDGNSDIADRDSTEQIITQKWKNFQYGIISGNGSTIAEVAANEAIGTKGQKYWSGCQAWISAVGGPTGADWCSIFVGWCIEQAGYNPADYSWAAGCTSWEYAAKEAGIWENSQRNAKVGYAAIFNGGAHTGIVIEVYDDRIVCAEGNSGSSNTTPYYKGSSVQHNTHYYSRNDIDGYVKLPQDGGNTGDAQNQNGKIRTTAPQFGDKNYMPKSQGGYSPFEGIYSLYPQIHGRGSSNGNCTAYCWGRACEYYGKDVANQLPTCDAGGWFARWNGNKGQTPKAGSIAVWDGHVAFVERVNDDGTILISQSSYVGFVFKTSTTSKSNNWGCSKTFFGFIYPK